MDDAQPVVTEIRNHVAIVRLNRPDERNSMTPEMLDRFRQVVPSVAADPAIRCVVITGSGKCFSAGADLKRAVQRDLADRARQPHERSFAMYEPFLGVLDIEVPVVGALNGHAVGGGFGLSLLCDVRIANREAKYGANFARLGLSAGLGISYLLPRLVGAERAAELLFTGRLVTGEEAERLGLVSEAVAPDEVEPRALELAERIASSAPYAVRAMKRSLYEGLGWRVREAAWREAHAQAASLATDDATEGMSALLDKREPEFTGR